jgi:transposase-like protein
MKYKKKTEEEKQQVLDAVRGGMTQKEAAEKFGVSMSGIQFWLRAKKKAAPRKAPKPTFLTMSVPQEASAGRLVVLIGAPSDVNSALERLAQIQR